MNGVKQVFLHQSDIFPSPYPNLKPPEMCKMLGVFGKSCLQFLCDSAIIPAVCVTNDWFTGMVVGYAKSGHFGGTFDGTTFMHIVHNLEPSYEGRIYITAQDGGLGHVHELPLDYLMDPFWARPMLNPSRCAILKSDQWGTVSKSYLQELMRDSPL